MADPRKCIGSTRFGIEPHEAPVEEFPKQPSQKDGLGRMCKPHWNQYTACLARDAKAREGAEAVEPSADIETEAANSTEPAPRRKRQAAEPTPDVAATEEPAT